MVDSVQRQLKSNVLLPPEPQIVTALGAALLAAGNHRRSTGDHAPATTEIVEHSPAGPSLIVVSKGPPVEKVAAPTEYWRWKEYNWKAPGNHWREARNLTAGVDVGSVSSQAVVLGDGELLAYSSVRTGSASRDSARKAMEVALDGIGIAVEDFHFIVGTGYGRVHVPFAQKTVTEISCHARGANYLGGPSIRTILDMGGQDCKAIRCDERGKVTTFIMNDKCAAGTGRGMEVMADLLQVPIDQLGPLSLSIVRDPPTVSSTCVVFARSEALTLLRQGWSKAEVLAAYCDAMARRVVVLLQRVGVEKELTITGGIAKNTGVVQRVEKALGVNAREIKPDPQIAGAVGAALFARDFFARSGKAS
ncbi:MAG: benzoyl-CoA reductase, bzd-type, subunit Q [Chloroflexi bacterium]|nr:benzoyl-CoA reductase, bzd-type, subunit Q [Chloroflexota bacterium]